MNEGKGQRAEGKGKGRGIREEGRRLYAVLDFDLTHSRNLDPAQLIDAWLNAGVRLIQLRAKTLPGGRMLELATLLSERTAAAGATLIVNDRVDIAQVAGASGVHVGQEDLTPAEARRILGDAAIVGLSTHNEDQIRQGTTQPVDYVAIGPVFGTSTKERPDPVVGLDGVRKAVSIAETRGLPVIGIGGITLERASSVIEAGAASVAVISDLLIGDIERRAREFLSALR